jgi:hypothetical protein
MHYTQGGQGKQDDAIALRSQRLKDIFSKKFANVSHLFICLLSSVYVAENHNLQISD